jgi:hypothetical protein
VGGHHLPYETRPTITEPIDLDATSLVAESYLSDHHVHQQPKEFADLSNFQRDFLLFCDRVAKLGSSRELTHFARGGWIFPSTIAQMAVDDAGNANQFKEDYRKLALHPENNIEHISDLRLNSLAWTTIDDPQAGRMDGVVFLSRIARQVLFVVSKFKYLFK